MRHFHIADEFAPLRHVVMGRGAGYHRDGARVEVVNETHRHTLARHAQRFGAEGSSAGPCERAAQTLADAGCAGCAGKEIKRNA